MTETWRRSPWDWAEVAAAWLLAALWLMPLVYAFWAAFHPPEFAINFRLLAPLTLHNFADSASE